jgi:hypothetical protein
MPRGKTPMTTAPNSELDGLFQRELESVHDDVRRKAALAAFKKLLPNNRVTVEEFFTGLQRHKDIWAAVATLGINDFAAAIAGRREAMISSAAEPSRRRTRLSDDQKGSLKNAILLVLEGSSGGKSRTEITAAIDAAGLSPADIARPDLAEKLRQPLHELIAENKLHTVGEKRLMKYILGGKRGR